MTLVYIWGSVKSMSDKPPCQKSSDGCFTKSLIDNCLFLTAVIFLTILLCNMVLRGEFMIELWNASAILIAVSFGAWLTIHSKYNERISELEKKRKQKTFDKMREITEITEEAWNELHELFKASNEPAGLFEVTWNFYLYSGLLFLTSVFVRLGVDVLLIQMLSPFEGLVFLAGALFFVGALLNTRNLMKLLKSDVDPQISLVTMIIVAIIQSLNVYAIWQLAPSFFASTMTFYQLVFFFLLWLTFLGAGIFLVTADEDETSKITIVGITLMFAPWLWIFIFSLASILTQLF